MDAELSRRFMLFINQSIEILNLSGRTLRALKRHNITHVHQLMAVSISDLAALERMNHQSALEANDAMCEFGLNVGVFSKEDMLLLVPLWEQMVVVIQNGDQEIFVPKDIAHGGKKIKDLRILNRSEHIHALEKLGVLRVKDLAKLTKNELYNVSGLGRVSADKLVGLLKLSGRSFRIDPGNADAIAFNRVLDVVKTVPKDDPDGLWKLNLRHHLISTFTWRLLSDCGVERIEQLEGFDLRDLPFAYGRRIRMGDKSKADIRRIAEIYGIELKNST